MMSSRKGFRARFRRRRASRKRAENRLEAQTRLARAQARQAARRDRSSGLRGRARRHRAQLGELWIWIKGSLLEIRRRARLGRRAAGRRLHPVAARLGRLLAPVGRAIATALRPLGSAIHAVLAPIAPHISRGLFFLVRAVGTLVAGLLDYTLVALGWVRARALSALHRAQRFYAEQVTPARAAASVAALAAVVLAVSQFIDYREITIGGEQLPGDAEALTPATTRGTEQAGDPHAYALLPLALIALALIWATYRGRWKLGRLVAAIGGIGMLVALGIDAPQGLDAGRAGEAYEGTKAYLLAGFWLEFGACFALLVGGLALTRYVRAERERPRLERARSPLGVETDPAGPPTPFGSGSAA